MSRFFFLVDRQGHRIQHIVAYKVGGVVVRVAWSRVYPRAHEHACPAMGIGALDIGGGIVPDRIHLSGQSCLAEERVVLPRNHLFRKEIRRPMGFPKGFRLQLAVRQRLVKSFQGFLEGPLAQSGSWEVSAPDLCTHN